MAGRHDIELRTSATFRLQATWRINGTPVNLTGCTAALDIRTPSGTLIVDAGAAGTITLGGAAGTITVVIPSAATATLAPGTYGYELLVTSAGGEITPLLEGRAIVRRGITS